MAMFWKSWILTYLPHLKGGGGGGEVGVVEKHVQPCGCISDSL